MQWRVCRDALDAGLASPALPGSSESLTCYSDVLQGRCIHPARKERLKANFDMHVIANFGTIFGDSQNLRVLQLGSIQRDPVPFCRLVGI
jgi:hypothetical protein